MKRYALAPLALLAAFHGVNSAEPKKSIPSETLDPPAPSSSTRTVFGIEVDMAALTSLAEADAAFVEAKQEEKARLTPIILSTRHLIHLEFI